jgi:polysaccharide pyruvyl transferase WcaK-like protein
MSDEGVRNLLATERGAGRADAQASDYHESDTAVRKTVYLYCAIGERQQLRPVPRTGMQKLKIVVGRLIDDVLWRLFRRWRYHYWRYEDHQFSNIGDIAIREACSELVKRGMADGGPVRVVTWDFLDRQTIDAINREAAAFIVAGSGYFIFDDSWRIGYRVGQDTPLFDAINVPKFMFSVGVNNPELREPPQSGAAIDAAAATAIGRMLASFAGLSVRDQLSKMILQPLIEREIAVVPDPALFLGGALQSTPPATPLNRVGLNFAMHSSIAEALLRRNFPVYVAALKSYQAESGCDYLYFVHSDSEHKVASLLAGEGIRLQKVVGMPADLIEQYRTLSFHVCQMLHSAILATATACPTLNIAYDVKSFGFYEMMGIRSQCISADGVTVDQILNGMRDVASSQQRLRHHLSARRAELEGKVAANLAAFKSMLADTC